MIASRGYGSASSPIYISDDEGDTRYARRASGSRLDLEDRIDSSRGYQALLGIGLRDSDAPASRIYDGRDYYRDYDRGNDLRQYNARDFDGYEYRPRRYDDWHSASRREERMDYYDSNPNGPRYLKRKRDMPLDAYSEPSMSNGLSNGYSTEKRSRVHDSPEYNTSRAYPARRYEPRTGPVLSGNTSTRANKQAPLRSYPKDNHQNMPSKLIGMDANLNSSHGLFAKGVLVEGEDQTWHTADSNRSLVVERLPKVFRDPKWIRDWALSAASCDAVSVDIDAAAAKALVEFPSREHALNAFRSPRMEQDKGKNTIRVWWHRPPERVVDAPAPESTEEVEEGEIEETPTGSSFTEAPARRFTPEPSPIDYPPPADALPPFGALRSRTYVPEPPSPPRRTPSPLPSMAPLSTRSARRKEQRRQVALEDRLKPKATANGSNMDVGEPVRSSAMADTPASGGTPEPLEAERANLQPSPRATARSVNPELVDLMYPPSVPPQSGSATPVSTPSRTSDSLDTKESLSTHPGSFSPTSHTFSSGIANSRSDRMDVDVASTSSSALVFDAGMSRPHSEALHTVAPRASSASLPVFGRRHSSLEEEEEEVAEILCLDGPPDSQRSTSAAQLAVEPVTLQPVPVRLEMAHPPLSEVDHPFNGTVSRKTLSPPSSAPTPPSEPRRMRVIPTGPSAASRAKAPESQIGLLTSDADVEVGRRLVDSVDNKRSDSPLPPPRAPKAMRPAPDTYALAVSSPATAVSADDWQSAAANKVDLEQNLRQILLANKKRRKVGQSTNGQESVSVEEPASGEAGTATSPIISSLPSKPSVFATLPPRPSDPAILPVDTAAHPTLPVDTILSTVETVSSDENIPIDGSSPAPTMDLGQMDKSALDDLATSFITDSIRTVSSTSVLVPPPPPPSEKDGLAERERKLAQQIAESKALMLQLTAARTKAEKTSILKQMRESTRAMDEEKKALAEASSASRTAPLARPQALVHSPTSRAPPTHGSRGFRGPWPDMHVYPGSFCIDISDDEEDEL